MLKENKLARQTARRNKIELTRFLAQTRPVDTREATPDAIRTARQVDYTLANRYHPVPVAQETHTR